MRQHEIAEVVARVALCEAWDTLNHTTRVVKLVLTAPAGGVTSGEVVAAAWLHDVLEDTDVKATDLADVGLCPLVVDAVVLLTNDIGDYEAYKERLLAAESSAGLIARVVKYADSTDNLARCADAMNVPKWARLAEERYKPMLTDLALKFRELRAA